MPNFVKCKQETYKVKRMKQEIESIHQTRGLFRIMKEELTFKEVLDKEETYDNHPVNLDWVNYIQRIKSGGDRDSEGNYISGTEKPGIKFRLNDCEIYWYYDNIPTRDDQFEEISTNRDSYKKRVVL